MDAAGVREKSGWFAAGAVALDGPIAAAFWSFLCVIVWRFRSCVEWCVQATDVSERSRNGSAYLGWLMPCVSHATGCGAGRVYHRPESKIKALEANETPALTPIPSTPTELHRPCSTEHGPPPT